MTIEIKGYYLDIETIKCLQKVGSNILRVWFYQDTETIDIHMSKEERSEIILMWEQLLKARGLEVVSQIVLATAG